MKGHITLKIVINHNFKKGEIDKIEIVDNTTKLMPTIENVYQLLRLVNESIDENRDHYAVQDLLKGTGVKI